MVIINSKSWKIIKVIIKLSKSILKWLLTIDEISLISRESIKNKTTIVSITSKIGIISKIIKVS